MRRRRILPFATGRQLRICIVALIVCGLIEGLLVRQTILRRSFDDDARGAGPGLGREKIYIASIHWNNEKVLRDSWVSAVAELSREIGRDNVFVSVQESGSWDDSKGALTALDERLARLDVPRRIVLDNTTHRDELARQPEGPGWIETSQNKVELRRVPYLSSLRNLVMEPLYELQKSHGVEFDKILFLNDVVFSVRQAPPFTPKLPTNRVHPHLFRQSERLTRGRSQTQDIRRLVSTRDGDYAAACSLDFSKPPAFYDTFALRDSDGHEAMTQDWPYFRSRTSRHALKHGDPVPVTSCWNGVVIMDASPFYQHPPLSFRGVPDSLAASHVEGSECCLVHADNPGSRQRGVWLNPSVRVGYSRAAYEVVNPRQDLWLSAAAIFGGLWKNRLLRWTTTPWFKERVMRSRVSAWLRESPEREEPGGFCLINEMQVLRANGWAHV